MTREKIQENALEIALNNKRCGLGISMGVGKTRIGIQHLMKNYNPFRLNLKFFKWWRWRESNPRPKQIQL